MKEKNRETIADMSSNEFSRIRAKQKLHKIHKGACKSSWRRIGSLKSFTLTIPWNLIKSVFDQVCEDLSWNHCTSTSHRSETSWIAERASRRVKEGTSVVLLQSGLDEKWWTDSMKCYIYLRNVQDLLSDGKNHMRDILGTHLKDWLFHLIHLLSIICNCEGPVKNPSIWGEIFTWIIPRIRIVRGESLEGGRTDRRPWEVGNDGRIRILLEKDSMRKRWYFIQNVVLEKLVVFLSTLLLTLTLLRKYWL